MSQTHHYGVARDPEALADKVGRYVLDSQVPLPLQAYLEKRQTSRSSNLISDTHAFLS